MNRSTTTLKSSFLRPRSGAARLGPDWPGVVGLDPETVNLVGFPGLHLLDDGVLLGPGPEVLHQRILVGPDALLAQFPVQVGSVELDDFFGGIRIGGDPVGGAADDAAPGHVQVAGDGDQPVDVHDGLVAFRHPFHRTPDLDAGGSARVHPGGLADLLRRYPGDRFRPLGRELPDPFGQLIVAVAPLVDEGVVNEFFATTTLSMARARALSVPGLICRKRSARVAIQVSRGSMTMILLPGRIKSMNQWSDQ